MAATKFVALQVTPDAREAVRRMAALITGRAMQRVTYAQALLVAERVMLQHVDDVADCTRAVLEDEQEGGTS